MGKLVAGITMSLGGFMTRLDGAPGGPSAPYFALITSGGVWMSPTFVALGSDRWPCRRLACPPCNGPMQRTRHVAVAARPLGHSETGSHARRCTAGGGRCPTMSASAGAR
jgi:hypothetical protein